VDIILPVYGAAAELRACLESVVREPRQRVTLVVDGPQDAAVESVIADFPVRILRNEQRLGFVRSVNQPECANCRPMSCCSTATHRHGRDGSRS